MPTTHRQIEPLCTPQSVDLVCVPRATVHKVWPKVCDLIYVAMKRGAVSSFKPVHDSVLAGAALLWLAWDGSKVHAAAVTELHKTEWRKVCVIVGCGGTDMKLWLHLLDGIEAARASGRLRRDAHHRPQGLGARAERLSRQTRHSGKGAWLMGGSTKQTQQQNKCKARRRGRRQPARLKACSARSAASAPIRTRPKPAR